MGEQLGRRAVLAGVGLVGVAGAAAAWSALGDGAGGVIQARCVPDAPAEAAVFPAEAERLRGVAAVQRVLRTAHEAIEDDPDVAACSADRTVSAGSYYEAAAFDRVRFRLAGATGGVEPPYYLRYRGRLYRIDLAEAG